MHVTESMLRQRTAKGIKTGLLVSLQQELADQA